MVYSILGDDQSAPNIGNYGSGSVTDTATLIRAANPDRKSIIILNEDTVNEIRIGDDNSVKNDADGSADEGLKIGPGASVTLETTRGDIYGIARAGQTVIVSYYEEAD